MSIFEYVAGAVMLVAAIVLTIVIIMQESGDRGMNALTGVNQDSYYGKNSKSRTKDKMLARLTKITAIVFVAVVVVMDVLAVLIVA